MNENFAGGHFHKGAVHGGHFNKIHESSIFFKAVKSVNSN